MTKVCSRIIVLEEIKIVQIFCWGVSKLQVVMGDTEKKISISKYRYSKKPSRFEYTEFNEKVSTLDSGIKVVSIHLCRYHQF